MWSDKHYYPGRIVNFNVGTDNYLVAFEDGDKRRVKKCDIIVCDLLGVGQWVFAERPMEAGSSETALIMGHYVRGGRSGYIIEFNGGTQERYFLPCLILKVEIQNLLQIWYPQLHIHIHVQCTCICITHRLSIIL